MSEQSTERTSLFAGATFPDAQDREFVWETLRHKYDEGRAEYALQALDRIFDRYDGANKMLSLCADDTSYADLRQEIEFKRTTVTDALDVLEDRTACHCHLYVEFPRIQEIKGPNPPRACPRCKAIDAIRAAFAGWCE